jgi:hypothetical protein
VREDSNRTERERELVVTQLIFGGLWSLAAWQVVRVARHLRGGALAVQFWWIAAGLGMSAAVELGDAFLRVQWEAGAGEAVLTLLRCIAWGLLGVGFVRLRRVIEGL